MAEGPVVHRYVKQFKEILEGQEVRIEVRLKSLKAMEPELAGVASSTSRRTVSSSASTWTTSWSCSFT